MSGRKHASTTALVREIERAGGQVVPTRNGHLMVTGPAGRCVVSTGPGARVRANTVSDLRRHAGVELGR